MFGVCARTKEDASLLGPIVIVFKLNVSMPAVHALSVFSVNENDNENVR